MSDVTIISDTLSWDITLNLEPLIAGADLDGLEDTNASDQAAEIDRLRALPPQELEQAFRNYWPEFTRNLTLKSGDADLTAQLEGVEIPDVGDVDLGRQSVVRMSASLPAGDAPIILGWVASYGGLVIRQMDGGTEAYSGYLTSGAMSDPIPRVGVAEQSRMDVFLEYIVIGFEHIIPKGLDHILFVLGLFFLSSALAPLLWQVSAFTLAHTITLALAILGYVSVPATIVEPLIAASIVYVGVENVLSKGLSPWRPAVVFVFGLLHGLGFASVLGDIGLNPAQFVTGLIGFNIGVELGQLAVIAIAFLLVGLWFGKKPWYRAYIANPASIAIALIGAFWVVERTLL
ncbi:HupE/UreJ family protein [Oceaniglobus ichthyenteri]|uniref:HupE/UreJ family protein n=1 Tax=Oceaniglobus ichthyenteri TaxID=2136177 RepID=UPI001F0CB93D|nr:HupE/UreJ family protein [Oceaniglobus ichthyenteri]